MPDKLQDPSTEFSAGNMDDTIQALINSSTFGMDLKARLHEMVSIWKVEKLVDWGERSADRVVTFETHRPLYEPASEAYRLENGEILSEHVEVRDEGPKVIVIPNAVPTGPGTMGTEDGKMLWVGRNEPKNFHFWSYGLLAKNDPAREVLAWRRPPPEQVIPEAVYLEYGSKYFANDLYSLAGMALAREVVGNARIPLVTQAKRPPNDFFAEAIRRIGFDTNEIVFLRDRPAVQIERLWVPYVPIRMTDPVSTSAIAMAVLQHRLGVPTGTNSACTDKVYISRQDATWRKIGNESEVLEVLQDYGFRTVEFGGKTAAECIDEMKNAKVVFGLTGSNMTNSLFAPRGAWVVEVVPGYYDRDGLVGGDMGARLQCSFGHQYIRNTGEAQELEGLKYVHWDVNVSCDNLRTTLDFVMDRAGLARPRRDAHQASRMTPAA